MDIRARTNVMPLLRSAPAARNAAAGLLGAVTAIGMTVVLSVAAAALTLLVSRARGAHLEDLAAAGLSRGVGVEILAAAVLSLTVLGAFSCGGYVAVRMSGADSRRQALSVWAWTAALPVVLNLAALAAGGPTHRALAAVETDQPITALLLSSTGLALLGALLGADLAARGRAATAPVLAAKGLPGTAALEPTGPEASPGPALVRAIG